MRVRQIIVYLALLLSTCLYSQGTWVQMPSLPAPGRMQVACFSLNNKVYVGCGTNPYRYDLWEYNPITYQWTQKANFPGTGRGFCYSFSIGASGYIGGGSDGWTNLNDHWEYNSISNSWIQRANFPAPFQMERYGFTINGKGYVGGGGNVNDLWEYDPAGNNWTQKMNTPGGAMGAVDRGAFVINNRGFVVNSVSELWEYDPAVNSWVQRSPFPGPARYGGVGFGIGCYGVFGFGAGPLDLPDIWMYHQPTDTWFQMQNVPVPPRTDAGSAVASNEGYIFCGGLLNDMWKFIPPACNTLFATVSSTSSPCNAALGTAIVTPVNGTPPYSYLWTPGNQTTPTATGLTPGTYTVTITDATAQTGSVTCYVPAPYVINAYTFPTNADCGMNNGQSSVFASGGNAPYTFLWSNGATSQMATGLSPGMYSVMVTDASGCTTTVWAQIGQDLPPPPLNVIGDTIICPGESTQLTAFFPGFQQYQWLWSTGWQGVGVNVSPTTTTTYSVMAWNGTCISTDSITVSVILGPMDSIIGDTQVCLGQSTTLSVIGNATGFNWSNGSTTSSITLNPTASQTLYVIGSNSTSCVDTAFIYISVLPSPWVTISPQITSTTYGQTITLHASGGIDYLWNNGQTSDSITVLMQSTTTFCVTTTNLEGCSSSACVSIVVDASCEPFIPTAFSPGSDGNNDIFRILDPCVQTLHLYIYDRWGKKILETSDRNFSWDGTFQGQPLNSAVFTYYISGTLRDGTPYSKKGNITLVR